MKFINPLKLGLLGGIANWANQMEKYNMLNMQLNASKERYKARYDAMAQVQAERAKNNQLLQAMKTEIGQRQSKSIMTDPNTGEKYVSLGRNVPDPQDPTKFVHQEDARMSIDEYNKAFGKGATSAGLKSVAPGSTLVDTSGGTPKAVYTAPARPSAQDEILKRQQKMEEQRTKDKAALQKAAQERADLAHKVNRVEDLTNKDLKRWDDAGTDADKLKLLKDAGVTPPAGHPGMLYGTNPPTADEIDAQRSAYEDAMRAKHAKNLGVPQQAVEEGGPAAAVDESGNPTDGSNLPTDDQPTIKTGADGKKYKILGIDPDTGKVRAEPLAMDAVDLSDDSVAQAQPQEGEDQGGGEDFFAGNDNSDLQGLLSQYQQQSDQGYQDQMNQLGSEDEDQQQGLMTGSA